MLYRYTPVSLIISVSLVIVACTKDKKSVTADSNDQQKPSTIILANEDIFRTQSNVLTSGPVITGSIQPERKADLRAEISTKVLQVLRENGEVVRRGDIIVKLDDTAIKDSLESANHSLRNAMLARDQIERNLQRLKALHTSGMTSMQSLDEAEVKRNAIESEVSSSIAIAAAAKQQLQRTVVRAPFDGVISERRVSAGDTTSSGKELVKVIDPNSMRFVGRVATNKIGMVKPGQSVFFHVNGYEKQQFKGTISRVELAANDLTRQVEVHVTFVNSSQPKVSGLYAEGTVETDSASVMMLPETSIVKQGDRSFAWKVMGTRLKKVELILGHRDARTGNVEVRNGLSLGDSIIRVPNSNLNERQVVQLLDKVPNPGDGISNQGN